jgi:hypothetical protein
MHEWKYTIKIDQTSIVKNNNWCKIIEHDFSWEYNFSENLEY